MLTLISFGLNLILYILSVILIGTIFGSIFLSVCKEQYSYPYALSALLVGITQFIISRQSLKNNYFRKGIYYLITHKKTTTALTLSSLFIFFIIHISNNKYVFTDTLRTTINFISLAVAFFLLYYWRHRIKQTYIENLRRLEIVTYENTIADKDKQIKELKANNAYLAQIIHKYRKVIPAMELSVMELLQNNTNLDAETLCKQAESLQIQLEELRTERNNLLDHYQKDTTITPQSGLHTIDALLSLMEKRAKQEWILYKTQIDPTVKEIALSAVKEADLLHLLGDLIENAINAVADTEHKEILIHLGKLNNCLLLEISDSGTAFDIQTYQHFGNEPYTSHEETGGSGTGLMDIWKLKKEYKISLYIYEYETGDNVYTKKISFLFDRKNHFLLKTYRDKEVKSTLLRGDLHVFPHKTD